MSHLQIRYVVLSGETVFRSLYIPNSPSGVVIRTIRYIGGDFKDCRQDAAQEMDENEAKAHCMALPGPTWLLLSFSTT